MAGGNVQNATMGSTSWKEMSQLQADATDVKRLSQDAQDALTLATALNARKAGT